MGYVRENGEVGVRNEIWIIPTVGCVNQVAVKIAQLAKANLTKSGIHAFTHPHGCSQVGDDHLNTQKILAGLVNNPNAGGVLVLGLGCENNNIDAFKQQIGAYIPERVKFLNIQDSNDEIEEGTLMIYELMEYACRFKRQKVPAGKLIVGLNCGGSDGFSGITANPLVGRFSDALVGFGGIPIMTEVPEMFGAETILMNRCADESIFQKTVDMINGFKEHYIRHGQTVYENPSPGNKQGGISTLEEKSLGCIQKGGETEVTAIIGYGQKAADSGLNLLNGPGNDIVANTLLAASGAQIIIFTTGRGTPVGAPVPTIKVSSNTALFDKKNNWMDFDAGVLLTESTLDKLSDELISYVLAVASGEAQTKNEINGYREIAIFKDGATL
jgi:altronate hydrolase